MTPVYTRILLNILKCQGFLGFKTAVSKMVFLLMANSKLSVEECTKPACWFFSFLIVPVSPD